MTRIFKNCYEAINEIERDIIEMGIDVHPNTMQNKIVKDDPNFDTKEVQNYSFTILDTSDKDKIVPNLCWCKAEFAERIFYKRINPGEAWKLRKEVWEEFLNKEKIFDYTYNERINDYDQLNRIIKELKQNPDTRQAIIMIHSALDILGHGKERISCSIYYQLMVRRNKLDIIYNMRSSDFATHFKNDIWLACALRDYIAKKIDRQVGLFSMNIGSLHLFRAYGQKDGKHVF